MTKSRARREAAGGEPEHDRPFDMVGDMMAPAAGRLGDGGVEQVGADRELRGLRRRSR